MHIGQLKMKIIYKSALNLKITGFNILCDSRDALFTEGTIRHLLGKYSAEHLIKYYNEVVQSRIFRIKDIESDIHIIDCTKIAVNFDNHNYENYTHG